ncbi:Type IV secretion system protein TraG/VirD4, partial [uncultured Caudovirales phage]
DPLSVFEDMRNSDHPFVSQAGSIILAKPDRERDSVISTANTALELFRDPVIALNTYKSDWNIIDLVNGPEPMTLYIITPGSDEARLRPLVRLLLAQILRTLLSTELSFVAGRPAQPFRFKLLMQIDEFPSLKFIDAVEDSTPKAAGWGIKFDLICQDRSQLQKTYGQHETILANCHIRCALAPNSTDTAAWLSTQSGETTVLRDVWTESGKRASNLNQVSHSVQEVKRPLLTTDEIMRLPMTTAEDGPGEMLAFVTGMHPVLAKQCPYYLDKEYLRRSSIVLV